MISRRRLQDLVFAGALRWVKRHHAGSTGRSKSTWPMCRHSLLVQSDCNRKHPGKTPRGIGPTNHLEPGCSAHSLADSQSKLLARRSCRNWRRVSSTLHYDLPTMNCPWTTSRVTWQGGAFLEGFCSGAPTMG